MGDRELQLSTEIITVDASRYLGHNMTETLYILRVNVMFTYDTIIGLTMMPVIGLN